MQVFRSLYNQYYTKPQILYMFIIPCEHVRKTTRQLWEFRKSPCDYSKRPFCAINLLMKWAKFVILHTTLCKSFIHNKVNYTLKCPVIIMLHLYQYELLQFNTPSPCFMPFCFNALWLAAFYYAKPLILREISLLIYVHFFRNATRA
jgi:hypothetical protein